MFAEILTVSICIVFVFVYSIISYMSSELPEDITETEDI